ncbi:ABC transporter ATP-binding protein [Anaerocolumna sp.]|uniref:ABC transporter ATP-binding protein n=1 Tax=Anaerocolumna sp. TaxID=2041569 RepID=UPI0028A9DADC|nr:ATP-binding cassette domain-containing protein [Anaerocolumna sp.]
MNGILLETKNLSFNQIIQYKDIQIKEGKVNFIVGRSGTGKSTLLKLFNGMLSPSNGTIFYHGYDISQMDTIELRKEVLLISQSVYLFDGCIEDNFKEFYRYRDMPAPSREIMKEFLKLCCIPFPLDKDCITMSGGEKQRVYIAIYLSFLPKIIMLDEPTSALDKENSNDVMENVITFAKEKGITVIIVSHDPKITDKFAEEIITIERGVE